MVLGLRTYRMGAREREKRGELEGAYLRSHSTPDNTGELHQI
jgi:hypothetical protein